MKVCRCFCAYFLSQFETETPFFNGQREKSFVSSWRRWMPRGWWRNHFTICLSLEFSRCEWRKGSISLTRSTTVQGRKDLNKTNSPHSCTVPLWVFDLMLYWCLNMLQVAPLINLYKTSSGTLTLNIIIYRILHGMLCTKASILQDCCNRGNTVRALHKHKDNLKKHRYAQNAYNSQTSEMWTIIKWLFPGFILNPLKHTKTANGRWMNRPQLDANSRTHTPEHAVMANVWTNWWTGRMGWVGKCGAQSLRSHSA